MCTAKPKPIAPPPPPPEPPPEVNMKAPDVKVGKTEDAVSKKKKRQSSRQLQVPLGGTGGDNTRSSGLGS